MQIVNEQPFTSVAFVLIGVATGGLGAEGVLDIMLKTLQTVEIQARVILVKYTP